MAAVMKVRKNLIARIWKEADLKPHRMERYRASNDPQFEEKAAAIIGLYLNPAQTAAVFCAVFCVDEKSAIQARDRPHRRLPLSPGRAEKGSIPPVSFLVSLGPLLPTVMIYPESSLLSR